MHYDYVPNDEMTSYLNMVVDLIAADLPGAPEHSEPHEVKEPEMDGELIDAILELEPFLAQPPFVSDERDIDEGDEDEVIAFKNSIVGSSASQLGTAEAEIPCDQQIHAVEFRLDGSGAVNVLNTDVTRDPSKLELRMESTRETPEGQIILRRYDLNDEERQRQIEKELYIDDRTTKRNFAQVTRCLH